MTITILSLFPEIIEGYLNASITKRAINKGALELNNINIRDFSTDKHRSCDDHPFGGGAGMVLKAEPLANAIEAFQTDGSYVIYPGPGGKIFNQKKALELSERKHIIFIAGRYEGIDQRIIDHYVDEELSLGDYVMASGELSSMVMADCVMRLLDGVIATESLLEESFTDGLLEYPHYTRPEQFRGMNVPDILLSGHHKKINEWRFRKRVEKTLANRPEIMHTYSINMIVDKLKNKK